MDDTPKWMWILIVILATGCSRSAVPPTTRLVATRMPTIVLPSAHTASNPVDTGWIGATQGIEVRTLSVAGIAPDVAAPVYIVRLDPSMVRLRVQYAPDTPQPLRTWVAAHRPLVAVNGGFFTADHRTTALLVTDGTAHGVSYTGFGGMLAVSSDGRIWIQALRDEPYNPAVPLDQAIQSFPMLVYPGSAAAEITDNGQRARRTAVAIDRVGRVLIIVCPISAFSLQALAAWLVSSDLEIDRALNLDGGSSSGLFVNAGEIRWQIDSFAALPSVLLVEPRQSPAP
ncbi:MAG: phosphodiester glycosidase family protein [Roseiflexus sp.]|nr:phosphodiester glycosidase family protein [Roseiflexus sp.]MCS7288481.1 phosphodiester glycosidase family protein [Roseiflexus sp.]MDW8147502.1 phosphodiester glycosidase family protein [Roseiflexaceae bacterium]MDW8234056.1 phosphodiester glycosidase family protein [Roseiflexaceae bacterium]